MNRLSGLEIDEISLVDRPANQHGVVAITKRDSTGDDMAGTGLYDADGSEYDADELEPGMAVLDADGERRILLDEETAQALEAEGVDLESTEDIEAMLAELGVPDDASELDGELVGKAAPAWITGGASSLKQAGKKLKSQALGLHDEARTNPTISRGVGRARAGVAARPFAAAGGAAAAGAGVGYGVHKGLGASVLESLSKSYTDGERDRAVSKAFDDVASVVSKAEARAKRAETIAKAIVEREEIAQFTEIAKSYQLPVDPSDLGPILRTIAKSGLSEDQLDLVDQVFTAAGEAIYVEKGFSGRQESGIMEIIGGEALELVGKTDGSVSPEQAAVAIMTANAGSYEDYLTEQRG